MGRKCTFLFSVAAFLLLASAVYAVPISLNEKNSGDIISLIKPALGLNEVLQVYVVESTAGNSGLAFTRATLGQNNKYGFVLYYQPKHGWTPSKSFVKDGVKITPAWSDEAELIFENDFDTNKWQRKAAVGQIFGYHLSDFECFTQNFLASHKFYTPFRLVYYAPVAWTLGMLRANRLVQYESTHWSFALGGVDFLAHINTTRVLRAPNLGAHIHPRYFLQLTNNKPIEKNYTATELDPDAHKPAHVYTKHLTLVKHTLKPDLYYQIEADKEASEWINMNTAVPTEWEHFDMLHIGGFEGIGELNWLDTPALERVCINHMNGLASAKKYQGQNEWVVQQEKDKIQARIVREAMSDRTDDRSSDNNDEPIRPPAVVVDGDAGDAGNSNGDADNTNTGSGSDGGSGAGGDNGNGNGNDDSSDDDDYYEPPSPPMPWA